MFTSVIFLEKIEVEFVLALNKLISFTFLFISQALPTSLVSFM